MRRAVFAQPVFLPMGDMMRTFARILLLCALVLAGCAPVAAARLPERLDESSRVLVLSAFDQEMKSLLKETQISARYTVNGRTVTVGRLAEVDVVLAESGVSMVNAAMTAQALLDRFPVRAIIFSGIAGGVNPELHIGDVVVPAQWGEYQESHFARQAGDGWDTGFASKEFANYGMIFPQPVEVVSTAQPGDRAESRFWFPVDESLLDLARQAGQQVVLERCALLNAGCLAQPPKVITGGHGVSGSAFVDNAGYRLWAWQTFQADALDMETAAVAHVAYANGVPFIAFRSLSDLAGGGENQNELPVFYSLAARNAARVTTTFLSLYAGQAK